jgi:hypothetical protein
MALERNPVEETQEPGYPTTNEYITGRRAFIGLLALGAGGAIVLMSLPGSVTGGDPMPSSPPTPSGPTSVPLTQPVAVPQANVPGRLAPPQNTQLGAPSEGGVKPVRPQAQLEGDVIVPKPPARPEAAIEGDTAIATPPRIKSIVQPSPRPPAEPAASAVGGIRAPVQPKPNPAEKPPAKPQADAMGY